MRRILVLGGSGLVGNAIFNELNKNSNYKIFGTYYKNLSNDNFLKLNIDNSDEIDCILNSLQPEIIVSCLRGDFNKQLALHKKAVKYLKETNGKLYFFSTANVFDNDLSKIHYEDDLPDSHTDYGKYKIECEKVITEALENNAVILRIPQVWGKNCPRLTELLNSLHDNKEIEIFPELIHTTILDVTIARQLSYIIDKNYTGIFHLTADDIINYKEFYCRLITGLGYDTANVKDCFDLKGYFALLSKRKNEFPDSLRISNEDVIKYLTQKEI